MNPFHWLLKKSEELAHRRGGAPSGVDVLAPPSSRERPEPESESYEIDGAWFWNGRPEWSEQWAQLSPDRERFARVVGATDGSLRLCTYVRLNGTWTSLEGPSIMASLPEAIEQGKKLIGASEH